MSDQVKEPKAWAAAEYAAVWRAALGQELASAKANGDADTVKAIEAQLGRKKG